MQKQRCARKARAPGVPVALADEGAVMDDSAAISMEVSDSMGSEGAACSHLHEGSRRGSVSAVGSSAARSVHRWRGKRPRAIMYVMKALFPVCLRSDYPPCSPALAGSMQMVGMVHGGARRHAAACGCPEEYKRAGHVRATCRSVRAHTMHASP